MIGWLAGRGDSAIDGRPIDHAFTHDRCNTLSFPHLLPILSITMYFWSPRPGNGHESPISAILASLIVNETRDRGYVTRNGVV